MQGIGSFSTHKPAQVIPPIKLSLVSTCGRVNLIATFDNQEVCIATFHNGIYDPQIIPQHTADKMGIQRNSMGYIRQSGY